MTDEQPIDLSGEITIDQTAVDKQFLSKIVEAIILTANRPLSILQLQKVLGDDAPDKKVLQAVLAELSEACADRGVDLVEVASGWRYQAKEIVTPWVSQLFEEKPQRYSRATLETLALIAYRQPITRGEIEEVRGVAVSSQIIRSLEEREWVKVVGYRDVPGRPAMYATTREFLDDLGLKSLENLPVLADVRELGELNEDLELELPPELLASLTPISSPDDQENTEQAADTESEPEKNAQEDSEKAETASDIDDSCEDVQQEKQNLSALAGLETPESTDTALEGSIGSSDAHDGLIPSIAIEASVDTVSIVQDFICVFDDHLDAGDKVIDALDAIEESAIEDSAAEENAIEGAADDNALEIDGSDTFDDGMSLDGKGASIPPSIGPPAPFDSEDSTPPSLDDE